MIYQYNVSLNLTSYVNYMLYPNSAQELSIYTTRILKKITQIKIYRILKNDLMPDGTSAGTPVSREKL